MSVDATPTLLAAEIGLSRFAAPRSRCYRCSGPLEPPQRWVCAACDAGLAAAEDEKRQRERAAELVDLQQRLGRVHDAALLEQPEIKADEWSSEAIFWARTWTPGGPGAWMHGDCGSGKSTILGRLGRRLLDQGVSVAACSLQRMCSTLAALHFSRQLAEHQKAVGALSSVQALLLDDVLAHTPNRQELDELLAVLDARWNARRPVIVTANLDRAAGLAFARKAWMTTDPVKPGRVLSRLEALTGLDVRCWYPGDRRCGTYDEAKAEQMRAEMQCEQPPDDRGED